MKYTYVLAKYKYILRLAPRPILAYDGGLISRSRLDSGDLNFHLPSPAARSNFQEGKGNLRHVLIP